jgi:tetratricopeptide (TPR) repeat protein
MMRAEVAEAQGRMVEAADLWQGALEKSGGRSTRAARGLARVLCAHGDPDGALRILLSALPPAGLEEVTDGQFLEDLARHYSRLGAQERALEALWVAVERDPKRAGTPILLAELLLELGQVELALGPLVRSADARPCHRPTRIALARVRADLYQWTQALEEYQAAANLAPLLMAETLSATRCVLALPADGSRVRWAIRVQDWLELHSPAASQHGATLLALGELCTASGSALEACAHLERAAGLDPGDAPTLLALTRAYLRSEQCERAMAIVAHAQRLDLSESERAAFTELQTEIKIASARIDAVRREGSDGGQDRP